MFIGVNLKCAHHRGAERQSVLVRARSEQNRWLEESGVIRRLEEAGMMGQNRFDSYKAPQPPLSLLAEPPLIVQIEKTKPRLRVSA